MNQSLRLALEPQVHAYEGANECIILLDVEIEGSHVIQVKHPTEPVLYDVEFSFQPDNDVWEWDVIGEQPA